MPTAAPSPRALTIRSLLLGLGLVAVVSLGAPYSIWMVGSSEMTWSYFPIIVGAPFSALVLLNALLGRWLPERVLTPGELVVILSMGLVVTGVPIFIVGTLLAIISSPYYAATPENDWAGYIQPYLPNWAIPSPDGEAMRWFYEGAPRSQPLPLHAWAGPVFWWLSLILAVYFVCFCMVVILRKQWVVHERLIFPLTEMPRLMIEDRGNGLLGTKTFWIGCGVPLTIILFNVISFFYPGFPQIAITQAITFQLTRDFPVMYLMLFLPVTGFMFMASSSVSFSIWFFYLVAVLQEGITNRIGYDVTHPDAFVWGMQSLSWQGWGTFTAMVLWSLWMGRDHLRAVYRRVFKGGREVEDADEMLSYRAAVIGMVVALLYILGWLWMAGMSPYIAVLFVFGVLVAYLGITRLVVQAGMYYLTTPVGGQAFALAITGTRLDPTNLVSLSINYAWFGDVQSVFMPSAANAAKMNEWCGGRRGLGAAMGLAVVTGFLLTIYFVLYLSYKYGAGNFRSWYFAAGGGAGGMAFDGVIRQLNDPWGTDWNKLSYFGIGLVLYSVLAFCQYRFHWWPLHPVGLATAPLWMTRSIVLSVFLGWLLKSVILRYGGIGLYRQARPFFVGIIVGFFLGVALSYLVDHFWFFGLGHYIHNG